VVTVKERGSGGSVVVKVDETWKGEKRAGLTVGGETGYCVVQGPADRFLRPGKRYLLFLFEGDTLGRLGGVLEVLPGDRVEVQPSELRGQDPESDTLAEFRREVARYLSPEFRTGVVARLGDGDPAVRTEALSLCRRLRMEEARSALIGLLATSKHEGDRRDAVRALSGLEPAGWVPQVIPLVSDRALGADARAALGRVAGRDLGSRPGPWQRWWEARTATPEPR